MALSGFETTQDTIRREGWASYSYRFADVRAAILPLLLILLWTAAVRLPFYQFGDGDEFFFSVVAKEWLHGGLPYVAAFDVKPPGLFFIYAVIQAIFGASYATFKGMEIAAVALGAWSLYLMLRPYAAGRLSLWAAALFPVYTLGFVGTSAMNVLLQIPFIIAAFAAVVTATDPHTVPNRRLRAAFLAGLAIGAAGMIKQTAIFEAVAAFILIWAYGDGRGRLKMLALFVAGAALPAAAFSAYFLANSHFLDMFNDVVVLAMQRNDAKVLHGYGPKLAPVLTLRGAAVNTVLLSVPLTFLWVSAIFTRLRIERIRPFVPPRLLIIAAVWLALAFAGAVFGRMIGNYYLLVAVAPLLILSGPFICCGMDIAPSRRWLVLCVSIVLAATTLAVTDRRELFRIDLLGLDRPLDAKAVRAFDKLGVRPGDRLLVVNRGMELYIETGMLPPTPCFHPTQLLSTFPTPMANPLGDALKANPRFIVLGNTNIWQTYDLPGRLKEAKAYLAAHYRMAAEVKHSWNNFRIYEFAH